MSDFSTRRGLKPPERKFSVLRSTRREGDHMNRTTFINSLAAGMLAAAPVFSAVADDGMRTYAVSITNLTRGVSFTPIMVATHQPGVRLYNLGEPPSDALAAMAEGGDTGPLAAIINATPNAKTASSSGLLGPGQTVTVTVASLKGSNHMSLAAMMLPTNDGFIAVTDMPLPKAKQAVAYLSNGHDAGSEPNDELCASIPGPTCQGEGGSPGVGGEGFVHIHAGIHGIGNLEPSEYDWRNPVARITVRQVDSE
jgi:hypothetical protein